MDGGAETGGMEGAVLQALSALAATRLKSLNKRFKLTIKVLFVYKNSL
jgi:hypothetical protein